MRVLWIYRMGACLIAGVLILAACQNTPGTTGSIPFSGKQPESKFQTKSLVGLSPTVYLKQGVAYTSESTPADSPDSFRIQDYLPRTNFYTWSPPPGFESNITHSNRFRDSISGPMQGSEAFLVGVDIPETERNSESNQLISPYVRPHTQIIDYIQSASNTSRKSVSMSLRLKNQPLGSLAYGVDPDTNMWFPPVGGIDVSNSEFSVGVYACEFRGASPSASVSFTVLPAEDGKTDTYHSTLPGKADVQMSVSGSGKVANTWDDYHGMSASVKFSIPVQFYTQVQCVNESDPSKPWYYDTLGEVPNRFKVPNNICEECPPDQIRDPDEPGQCKPACPPGMTSTNHGQTCVPAPSPTPSPAPSGHSNHVNICVNIPGGQSCFSCPEGSDILRRDGRIVGCSNVAGGVSTENEKMEFGIKAINRQAIFQNICSTNHPGGL